MQTTKENNVLRTVVQFDRVDNKLQNSIQNQIYLASLQVFLI
jgi:hypothetical protein